MRRAADFDTRNKFSVRSEPRLFLSLLDRRGADSPSAQEVKCGRERIEMKQRGAPISLARRQLALGASEVFPVAILVTANPIPSHPSPHHILNTLESLDYLGLPKGTKIFLLHDGLRLGQRLTKLRKNYEAYLKALAHSLGDRKDVHIVTLSRWGHISQLLRKGVSLTSAEYLVVVQHDLPFVRQIDLASILEFMRNDSGVRHVRFNLRKIEPEGQDAMTTFRGKKVVVDRSHFFGPYESASQNSVPLVRTLAWSDNNFVCSHWYLSEIILRPIGRLRMAPEWAMNGLSRPETHEILGTYVAGKYGDSPAIAHTDGRNSSASPSRGKKFPKEGPATSKIFSGARFLFSFGRRVASLLLFRAKVSYVTRRAKRMWRKQDAFTGSLHHRN